MVSNKRVMVAMSGGVDSAASVLLLKQQGYDVVGMTLQTGAWEMCGESLSASPEAGAAYLCEQLGVPHVLVDARSRFLDSVIQSFVLGYKQGITPNPCICCNNKIKFPLLLKAAQEQDCSWIATGHYARVLLDEPSPLYRGLDANKDQSYVLYGLPRQLFEHLLLPLGTCTKDQAKSLVERAHLSLKDGQSLANQGESQDICFVPQDDHLAFLQSQGLDFKPGDIVDGQGKVLGKHRGLEAYTIGQRHGLGIGGGAPLYVVRKDVAKNQLVAGSIDEARSTSVEVGDLNWLLDPQRLKENMRVNAKIRYRSKPIGATLHFGKGTPSHNQLVTVSLDSGESVAPGQAAVFYGDGQEYHSDALLGGGTILGKE